MDRKYASKEDILPNLNKLRSRVQSVTDQNNATLRDYLSKCEWNTIVDLDNLLYDYTRNGQQTENNILIRTHDGKDDIDLTNYLIIAKWGELFVPIIDKMIKGIEKELLYGI